MTWMRKISKPVLIVSILGLLMSGFYALLLMTAMYAPPEQMAQAMESRTRELLRVGIAVAILAVVCVASYFLSSKEEKTEPPQKNP
ncbi:MAG: hypothetical protein WC379_12005 [Methanoregula sp.]|jgi:hypothetical protein